MSDEFTAHGPLVSSLYGMFSVLESLGPAAGQSQVPPIAVFMAFSIEAYVNSVGYRKIQYWKEAERSNWRLKINLLHTDRQKEANWGILPLQFCGDIFDIRDKLAHGKPEKVKVSNFTDNGDLIPDYWPEWYRNLTVDWALKSKPKFRDIMIYLVSLYDLPESDHLRVSGSMTY